MSNLEQQRRFTYRTSLSNVQLESVPDLETFLPLSEIKEYLFIDDDNTDADALLINSRLNNFIYLQKYLNRNLINGNDYAALYRCIDNEVLLPFYPALTVNNIVVDGDTLDVDKYQLFGGRLQFQNESGYPKNIEIFYTSTIDTTVDVKNTMIRLIGVDYDNKDSSDKKEILLQVAQYKYSTP